MDIKHQEAFEAVKQALKGKMDCTRYGVRAGSRAAAPLPSFPC